MATICLVGAGALGARHLQALRGFREAHTIYVVEPSDASRENAKKIYEGTPGQENTVVFTDSLEKVAAQTQQIDVAVVATSSAPRRAIVEELVQRFRVDAMILEKVLFQTVKDLDEVGALLKEKGIRTWVNCPRRYFGVYQEIREALQDACSFQVQVTGSNWGMGCNGIHFIDLIAFLAGSADAEISVDGLDEEYLESKRRGFYEITGTLRGSVGRCSDFSITSYRDGDLPMSITVTCGKVRYIVFEWAKKCLRVTKEDGLTETEIVLPFQSQLTNIEIEDVLADRCGLTTYEESAALHRALMVPLSKFFAEKGFDDGLCPIT